MPWLNVLGGQDPTNPPPIELPTPAAGHRQQRKVLQRPQDDKRASFQESARVGRKGKQRRAEAKRTAMLISEVITLILLHANDLDVAIATELLLARFPHPFWIRIAADPVRDAVNPLLPGAWEDLTESQFPASLAISQSLIVESDHDISTVPAFRVAWICKFRPDLLTYQYTMRAAGAGRLDLIRILDAFQVPKFCMATMDKAAAGGHLAVVKFLHHRRLEGCTSWAMTWAAKGGHLDVIRFLHTNRTEGCRDKAITDAACEGNFDVVSFLQAEMHLRPPCIPKEVPARHFRYLHENFQWFITEHNAYQALTCGTPEEFKYCLTQLRFIDPYWMFEHLAKNLRLQLGHLKVLMDTFGDDDSFWEPRRIDLLIRAASSDMIEFLCRKLQERCSGEGLGAQILKFLVAKDPGVADRLDKSALRSAIADGKVEILKFLHTFPHLQSFWTSQLTNIACNYGQEDAARYLYGELGLPITAIPFYTSLELPSEIGTPNPVLMNLDHFGYDCSDNDFPGLFIHACHCGTLEQIERFSKRTPLCPEAYIVAIRFSRLEVLQFLRRHRSEEPDHSCLRMAVEKPVDFVRFFVEEAGMTVDVELLEHATSVGRLDVVKYICDLLPADTPLDRAISIALSQGHFEVAKFFHLKRRASGRLILSLTQKSSMDVVTFAIEHYAQNLDLRADNGHLDGYPSFDTFKYIIEGRHLSYTASLWGYYFENPDIVHYVITRNLLKVDHVYFENVLNGGCVSHLRMLVRLMPNAFQKLVFHRHHLESLSALAFIRAEIPHAITPANITKIITAHLNHTMSPCWFVAYLLDLYPDCFLPEKHLTEAAANDTVAGLLLWEKIWPGGCPAKAMAAACHQNRYFLVKRFLEKMDPDDPAWTTAKSTTLGREMNSWSDEAE
ncbi:hypothetical protein HDU96_009528 [Phlyctochytrium bullatum]|nr:hypothetical protein HDU96_009528 [Phlyctochytrium bullatum]